MAILDAMQSAAIRLVGYRPASFFGASNTFELEITDLVNEVAKDVCASHDWQELTKVHTIAGDGTTTEFDLPADYDRQLLDADVQDAVTWAWGYQHITNINDFLYREIYGFQPYPGGWIIYGGKMRFVPAPQNDAFFPYICKCYGVDSATSARKSEFTQDTDLFILNERLLTLGLIWRWREMKKLDFSGDQEAFMKAISEYAAKDAGSRIQRSGRLRPRGFGIAYPYSLGPA